MLRPQDIAHWYRKRLHDIGDRIAQAIAAQGENVEWCAAAALMCCRESGCWVESALKDRYQLRSVETLVKYAKGRGLHVSTYDKLVQTLAQGRFAGALAVMPRDGKPHGHVGVVDLDAVIGERVGVVEFNTSEDTAFVLRKRGEIECYILVPRGGPLEP